MISAPWSFILLDFDVWYVIGQKCGNARYLRKVTAHTSFIYDWPWIHYHGNKIDCCLTDHFMLLNIMIKPERQNLFQQNRHLTLEVLVRISLFSWRYHLCTFIRDGFYELLKFNQNHKSRFRRNSHFISQNPSERPQCLKQGYSSSPDTELRRVL
jgi:hypothetical protein